MKSLKAKAECKMDNPMEVDPIAKVLKRLADMEDKIHGAPWKSNIFRRAYEHIIAQEKQLITLKLKIEDLEGEKQGLKRCTLCGLIRTPVNCHNDCYGCSKAQYGDL